MTYFTLFLSILFINSAHALIPIDSNKLAAGRDTSFIINNYGKASAFGLNYHDSLGIGDKAHNSPQVIKFLEDKNVTGIFPIRGNHFFAVTSSGSLYESNQQSDSTQGRIIEGNESIF